MIAWRLDISGAGDRRGRPTRRAHDRYRRRTVRTTLARACDPGGDAELEALGQAGAHDFARDHTRHVCVDEVSQSSRPRSMPHRPSRCAAPCTRTARQRSARRLQTRRGSRGVRPPWTALRPTSCWAATVSTGSRPCATSPTRLALTRALRDVKKSRCLRVSLASRPRQKDGLRTHAPGFVTDTIRNNVSPCS